MITSVQPREEEVLKHQLLPPPVEHTNRSVQDQGDSGEAGSHTQGGPVEPLQVSCPEADLVDHQALLPKNMQSFKSPNQYWWLKRESKKLLI